MLLEIPNPSYSEMHKNMQTPERDININDHDSKKKLPVHVELGAWDYTKIKTQKWARVSQSGNL